jgi:hypothetical protein
MSFEMEMKCVFSEGITEFLNITGMDFHASED